MHFPCHKQNKSKINNKCLCTLINNNTQRCIQWLALLFPNPTPSIVAYKAHTCEPQTWKTIKTLQFICNLHAPNICDVWCRNPYDCAIFEHLQVHWETLTLLLFLIYKGNNFLQVICFSMSWERRNTAIATTAMTENKIQC